MKLTKRLVVIVVLIGSLLINGVSLFIEEVNPTANAYTAPGYNGKIAFTSNRDGNYDIYTVNPDGSNPFRLTNIAGPDGDPHWSPDGTKVAFHSASGPDFGVYIVNELDEISVNLTPEGGRRPQWSPDGSKVLFETTRDGNYEIYVMNADGSNPTRITNDPGYDSLAVWSANGDSIAFLRGVGSHPSTVWNLHVVDATGNNEVQLTDFGVAYSYPSWSPIADEITFNSYVEGNGEIYVVNANGEEPTRLTYTDGLDEHYVRWSPDGNRIAASQFNYNWDGSSLFIMNADGTNQASYDLSSGGALLFDNLNWSPDGEWLTFGGYHETTWSTFDLYVVRPDGTGITQLTTDGFSGYSSWQHFPNTPPDTVSDNLSAPYQTPTLANVLANDTDEEALSGDNLSISVQPSNGTATVVDGKVRYVPNNGFQGSDSLTYQICDSFLLDQKCSTGVLSITVQAPTAPALVVSKVNGETFSSGTGSYVTSSLRPTFSGTASPGAEIKVEIHSDPIVLTTTADGSGNWSVAPGFDLSYGEHMVYISATLYGLTTELDSFGLTIQPSLAETGDNLGWMVLGGLSLVGGSARVLGLRRKEMMRVRG